MQLDHMTRGRAMLGCGPGALVSDAYMLGIEPVTQRPRMDEALDAIMELLKCEEPVTVKTDWFEMRQARLHLAPYTHPHFPIAVASVMTPSGVIAAGRHGLGVLSLGAGLPGGPEALANQWKIGEETAAKHGKRMDRKEWRLVVNVHVADDDEEALRQVKRAERHETVTYFEETLGRPPGRSDDPLTEGVKMGTTLVGGVETVIKAIQHLETLSAGGFGGLLFRAHEWATREQTLRSLRAVRALRHAAVPGLARQHPRLERVGARQPQDDLRSERRGHQAGLYRCRPRGAGRGHAAHFGRARRGSRPVALIQEAAMQYGVVMFPTDYAIRPDELARAVESRGFESLWVPEHTHIPASRKSPWPGGGPLPKEYWHSYDPFVALAMAAAVTTKLRLGTGICLVIERDPITLAKEVASLDHLSGGRVLFGIGGGWNAEEMEDHGTRVQDALAPAARADPRHEGAVDEGRGRVPRRVRELRQELGPSQAGAEAAPADPHGRRRPDHVRPRAGILRRVDADRRPHGPRPHRQDRHAPAPRQGRRPQAGPDYRVHGQARSRCRSSRSPPPASSARSSACRRKAARRCCHCWMVTPSS